MSSGVTTYNMGDGADDRKTDDLEKLVRLGATVIGMQEGADRGDAIKKFLRKHPTWRVYQPKSIPGAASVPILYDTRGKKIRRMRTVIAVWRRFVGAGAGPSFAKAKAINIVVLEDRKTGEVHRYICTHFIASATRPGTIFNRRRDHFRDHARVLARVIGPEGSWRNERAVVMTDMNAERWFPGLAPVRNTGIGGWTPANIKTEHGRTIDHVLGLPGQRRAIETSSDHMAVMTA